MNLKIAKALEIVKIIEDAGGKAHVVGGAVRDTLLGRPIEDVDLATSFTPEEVSKVFSKVIPIGIDHGTVLVRYESESYEVTTYRTEEGYNDYRHPDQVEFVRSVEQDLARRDFTINAMALDANEQIIDPYGGREDLEKRLIRAVGHAKDRFSEDPLRMMRALRFSSQLGFCLDKSTYEAISHQVSLLSKISIERIAVEFEKLCKGQDYQVMLLRLKELKVHHYLPVFKENLDQIKVIPSVRLHGFSELIPFYCVKGSPYEIAEWIKAWKQSNQVKRNASIIFEAVRSYEHKPLPVVIYAVPSHLIDSFVNVLQAADVTIDHSSVQKAYDKLPIHSRKQLDFQAEDLMQQYPSLPKGPWIGEYLNKIEQAVVIELIPNENQAIKEWIKTWSPPETD
ncbi:CCA-adding enzyme [Halobacillus andaensis]|uniref:CCA-adding enzyme n=1 Tax=Halobacillus andaensis TaxID=1176239 RepID=A0A917B0L6_HALAA|nr:CCA tRNA nucleotidyltransferase [Halobacillus andaensis]MBP2003291.1 tRNA nucleotidyltransferase (CCA-adding enzyme) [Halobacillus andaensis]GGF09573.1 CCA-adding enzyme [Halobacillus andaensis]